MENIGKTLPYDVAYLISYKNMHPVTAWRIYSGWSIDLLAKKLDTNPEQICLLESTNLHLKEEWLISLSRIFKVDKVALKIRFNSYQDIGASATTKNSLNYNIGV